MMKTLSLSTLMAAACAVTLGAQATETTTATNIKMTGGKGVTLTGCIEADSDGGYLLTHVLDKSGVLNSYVLVSTNTYFAKHVGQRVEVEGKLADSRHGRVEVTTDTNADGVKSHSEADARHDAAGIRYLGPDHMKTIASFCQ